MSKENPTPASLEILDIKSLSPQTKMRYILEIFDIGKGTPEERGNRKANFLKLLEAYNQAIIKSKPIESHSGITDSDVNKKRIHNQIMEIVRSISLSKDLDPTTRELAEYLVHNRSEVERMVTSYFLGHDTSPNPNTYSAVRQARENPLYFGRKDDED